MEEFTEGLKLHLNLLDHVVRCGPLDAQYLS